MSNPNRTFFTYVVLLVVDGAITSSMNTGIARIESITCTWYYVGWHYIRGQQCLPNISMAHAHSDLVTSTDNYVPISC